MGCIWDEGRWDDGGVWVMGWGSMLPSSLLPPYVYEVEGVAKRVKRGGIKKGRGKKRGKGDKRGEQEMRGGEGRGRKRAMENGD